MYKKSEEAKRNDDHLICLTRTLIEFHLQFISSDHSGSHHRFVLGFFLSCLFKRVSITIGLNRLIHISMTWINKVCFFHWIVKKRRDSNKQAWMAYEKRHHWNELCIPTNNNNRIYECKIKQSRGINGIEVWIPRACVCVFFCLRAMAKQI